MAFAEDYVDVAERIRQFRERYPDGSLQPADLAHPYRVETIGPDTVITVVAAAYRTPTDERPGVGMASEPVPGKTAYTRGSELQNAETSAWGRAIVAALAADSKKDTRPPPSPAQIRSQIAAAGSAKGMEPDVIAEDFTNWSQGAHIKTDDVRLLGDYLKHLQA